MRAKWTCLVAAAWLCGGLPAPAETLADPCPAEANLGYYLALSQGCSVAAFNVSAFQLTMLLPAEELPALGNNITVSRLSEGLRFGPISIPAGYSGGFFYFNIAYHVSSLSPVTGATVSLGSVPQDPNALLAFTLGSWIANVSPNQSAERVFGSPLPVAFDVSDELVFESQPSDPTSASRVENQFYATPEPLTTMGVGAALLALGWKRRR